MGISRRRFIRTSGFAAIGLTAMSRSVFAQAAKAALPGDTSLVVIFLRGGVDGLALCAPWAEETYYRVRPTIALERPKRSSGSLIDLDGFFGLHPELAPLEPLWREKSLGVVHAVGSYELTRSHFQAQEFMETGSLLNGSMKPGWIGRCASCLSGKELTKSVAFASTVPRSIISSSERALVTSDIRSFDFDAPGWRAEAEQLLSALYAGPADPISRAGRDGLATAGILKSNPAFRAASEGGAVYPDTVMGQSLRQSAQLLKSGLHARCIFVNAESHFDTHMSQQPLNNADFRDLGLSVAALWRDLGKRVEKTVILVVTEFGRTVAENGSKGTDHGSGGAMLVLGGPVRGGKVYGRWPGLDIEQLHERRDLAVTTDFRDVFTEVAMQHLNLPVSTVLFPGHKAASRLGLLG